MFGIKCKSNVYARKIPSNLIAATNKEWFPAHACFALHVHNDNRRDCFDMLQATQQRSRAFHFYDFKMISAWIKLGCYPRRAIKANHITVPKLTAEWQSSLRAIRHIIETEVVYHCTINAIAGFNMNIFNCIKNKKMRGLIDALTSLWANLIMLLVLISILFSMY